MRGRVLIIAGSDSGGGAGIQADIKTVTALGGYAMTAITALTVQNTKGVFGVFDVPADFIARQIEAVVSDIGADAVKIGMVRTAEQMAAVGDALDGPLSGLPIVLDPVMVAKGGESLMDQAASQTFRARLLLRASLLTPNVPEAESLTGYAIKSVGDMVHTAQMLRTYGPPAVLVKGGHLKGARIVDVLVSEGGAERFESERIPTRHTHGTGCTLASAIAAGLAQGMALRDAVVRARKYVEQAILSAPGYGAGHGPLNHAHAIPLYRP